MFKRQTKWYAALLTAVALAGMIGCGGADNGGGTADPVSTNITRSTESTFSESARILSAREAAASGATWLNADSARLFDAELSAVRRTFPQVSEITAFPAYDLRTVIVAVRPGTAWATNWRRGEPSTGEPTLDALLAEFAPEQIRPLGGGAIENTSAYFTVRFGQSLNMVKFAERLRTASANITAADPSYTAGDGNNIVQTGTNADGSRRYVFSRGSGDCPAGCINRYSYEFAVSRGGESVRLVRETDGRID